ncbi:MAG: tetratricopeptide repeat protein [Sandaracinaceae bacterium]
MRATLVLLLLVPAAAAAQPPTSAARYEVAAPAGEVGEDDAARARDAYTQGLSELQAGRWADAARLFEVAYRLSGVPAALFNHATALRSLGRHRDARDAFAQLLRDHPDLDPERRAEAEARMREEAGRVALVLLAGLDDVSDARVLFDGASQAVLRHPVEIEADAGEHAVEVAREGYERWRREVSLTDGQRESFVVELVPIDSEELFESPIFWTIIGVVLVGGAITAGILIQDRAQLQPRGEFGPLEVRL